jgi:DNA polymerase-3 subunit alpha
VLGITQVDPLKYDLLWERFLGKHRTSWPDIDSDVGDRDVLIDVAKELYGEDAVLPVSNFNTLKLKSLIQDIARYYGVDHTEVLKITKNLEDEVAPFARDENTEKSVFVLKHDDCMEYSTKYRAFMEKYPRVQEHIETLFMQNRSLSRHAGGVIIAPAEELEKTMPIIKVRGDLQTPWTEGMNFRNLEDNGFIKFDFLGLALMEDVRNCIRRILVKQGNSNPTFADVKVFFDKHLDNRFNEPNDINVFKTVYHNEDFAPGIFQFTAGGAQSFCHQVKPTTITELAALTAIYRPGPLKANVHTNYIKTKDKIHRNQQITYDHPIIEEVLGPTLGYIVFQEQFMLLAQKLSGFSPADSDRLRKTLVKKSLDTIGKKGSERDEAKRKFVEGAESLHGIDRKISEDLWKRIEFFSVYGFNKSHAVAYAIDSYYAAWLFTYHPKEWLATMLQSKTGNPKKLNKTITEVKRLGYKFAEVDINYSELEWTFSEEKQSFVPPLGAIKKVGDTAVDEIMEHRPYRNIKELLYNDNGAWYHSKMNKGAFDSLCKVEAFSSLEEIKSGKIKNHKQLWEIIIGNYVQLKKGIKGMTKTQVKRLEKKGEFPPDFVDTLIEQADDLDDWTRIEKIEMNADLRSAVSNDMLFPEDLQERIDRTGIVPVTEIPHDKEEVGWFIIHEVQVRKTKNGKNYLRIKAGDMNNKQVWLKVWGNLKREILPYTIWLAEAKGDENWGPSTGAWKMKEIINQHGEYID